MCLPLYPLAVSMNQFLTMLFNFNILIIFTMFIMIKIKMSKNSNQVTSVFL